MFHPASAFQPEHSKSSGSLAAALIPGTAVQGLDQRFRDTDRSLKATKTVFNSRFAGLREPDRCATVADYRSQWETRVIKRAS